MANRKRQAAGLGWLVPLLVLAVLAYSQLGRGGRQTAATASASVAAASLRMDFIDVGQGDSILLSSGGKYLLVDAGENSEGDEVVEFLRDRGVERLEAVVGTHPDSDHIGGLDTVLDAFPADSVYMPGITANTETYEDVLDAVDAQNLTITVPAVGDTITLGEATFTVLWPPQDAEGLDDNNSSIVLRAVADGHSALLIGDLAKEGEEGILSSSANVDSDVLKVGHHGSAGSSTAAFLQAVSPQVCVISVGADNSYGHPAQSAMQRLLNVCDDIRRTDRDGTVTVTFAEGEVGVQNSK